MKGEGQVPGAAACILDKLEVAVPNHIGFPKTLEYGFSEMVQTSSVQIVL